MLTNYLILSHYNITFFKTNYFFSQFYHCCYFLVFRITAYIYNVIFLSRIFSCKYQYIKTKLNLTSSYLGVTKLVKYPKVAVRGVEYLKHFAG